MSDTQDKLTAAIVELAQQPKSVTVDGQTTTMPSIPEVLDALKHVAAQQASQATGNPGGIRMTKIHHRGFH